MWERTRDIVFRCYSTQGIYTFVRALLSQLYSITQPLMVTYGDSSYASNWATDTLVSCNTGTYVTGSRLVILLDH